jgi:hypothetical protein
MVQFCPKCGTKAPDDESVFCNKCGTRLPPVISEKTVIICPRCGTKAPDEQSVFCNKCGTPLQEMSPAPIQQATTPQAATGRPVMRKKSCPSCNAPLVDEISDYCNVCGSNIHEPAPLTPFHEPPRHSPERAGPAPYTAERETPLPFPEKTRPGMPVADSYDDGKAAPLQEKNRRPLLKWGIIAIGVIIILVVAAAFIPGMIAGTNLTATTPAPTTALQTQKTTQPPAPALTTAPVKGTTTPLLTTVVTTNPTVTVTANVSTTAKTNNTANVSANASATVAPTPAPTISSQPYAIGKGATDGKEKMTVNDFTFRDKLSDPVPSYAIGKKYLIVNITYENLQNGTAEANTNSMVVTDGGGFAFVPASDSLLEYPFNGNTIAPQEKRTGNMLFIVPPEATFLKFEYTFAGQNSAKFQLT